ncbi:putative erv1 / Alr family domain-containing protein [Neospora caninum Liverpool]|uniref:Sulfhydryl oxidase n=1 Tax=Neospora caninum (strain Liverpool) TaxID=572307 RepID=F0VIC7_NEOCL|nr:putative erv1 / Alr family domain-containing protein [Neospora caninum Liverpool]CBZ53488.1 putative erv1 / Alr family domain-containing protein [Neospora caninum Liverpool]CEL67476.1 TPA: erv1 / Alr family domain-containing protein,putative [Neospora caninum Liverpool]|eukprot:XP_003883520.1 putative erv1 / Alr family domain-containing protein [Neospora caninum Liverpool]
MGNSAGAYALRNEHVSSAVSTNREISVDDNADRRPGRIHASSLVSPAAGGGNNGSNASSLDPIAVPRVGVENEGVGAVNSASSASRETLSPSGGDAQAQGVSTAPSGAPPQGTQILDPSAETCAVREKATQTLPPMHPPIHFCAETNDPQDPCNAQWLLLWTYAAYASPRPNAEEQRHLRVFFEEFPDQCTFGPAARCYSEAVKTFAPRVESRRDLLLWLCLVENQCRLKLDVPARPCRYSELVRRWRYEDGYL